MNKDDDKFSEEGVPKGDALIKCTGVGENATSPSEGLQNDIYYINKCLEICKRRYATEKSAIAAISRM